MAGDWWVTVNAFIDGKEVEDPFGAGHLQMSTYNTASNSETEMWLDDLGNFWEYKLKVNVNYAARTFSTTGFVDNVTYESKVKITDGKVLEKLPQLLVVCLLTVSYIWYNSTTMKMD